MKKLDLKISMIILLILCWLLPIAIASLVVSVVVSERMSGQIANTVASSATKAVQNVDIQIEECINASRNATYYSNIEDSYNAYRKTGEKQKLYDEMTIYLAQQYRYNINADATMVFFVKDPSLFYATYSSGATYDNILLFRERYLRGVLKIGENLGTRTKLYAPDGRLYITRNLVDAKYRPFAMIVMDLNLDNVFEPLKSIWGYRDSMVYVDGTLVLGDDGGKPRNIIYNKNTGGAVIEKEGSDYYVYITEKIENQHVTYIIDLDREVLFGETRATFYILTIVLISLIPLICVVFVYLNRMVSKPVERLVNAAENISGGNYGYHIEENNARSREFDYLNSAFNEMSDELKNQFEKIYLEELAIRDANIKALQSQINPHFLNNTLEIINWEARLNGVYKVSSMIEALSTMLNSTLNRKNVQKIPLSEEMEYVDAYLYIISERMGTRLKIEKNVDESLLTEEVPRLIIQPIIENAVEHGMRQATENVIALSIYAEGGFMYITVRNTGNMSPEDEARVKELLESEETNEQRSVSIGIRNVNRRLKLMYGDECGLTIVNEGTDTLSRLTLKKGGELL